jgi:uncharacterized protein (DUF433 family)
VIGRRIAFKLNELWKGSLPRSDSVDPLRNPLSTPLCNRLSFVSMAPPNRIVLDPAIAHGKPVIRGTRLPVTVVVGSLAGGMTFEEVQREYDLTADDIRAGLLFVAELAEQESFHPLPAA